MTEELDRRITALEKGAQYDAAQEVIRQREMELLATLRDIRSAMKDEEGSTTNTAEVEQLRSENEKLKSIIAKQEYRISHLISGFESLMEQKAAVQS